MTSLKKVAVVLAMLLAGRLDSHAQVTPRVPSGETAADCEISSSPAVTRHQGGETARCDLDGDGVSENITVAFQSDGWSFTLRVNQLSVQGSGAGLDETFAIVDIDTLDGLREIAITEGGSDDNVTHFYGCDGNRIFSMGSIEGSRDIRIDGSGILRAMKRGEILQAWSYPVLYRLNPEHHFERIEMELYPMNTPVTLKKPFQLARSRWNPSPGPSLAAGDKAVILSSDGVRWCLVRTAGGATGWFEIDSEGRLVSGGSRPEDIFGGLRLE
jgi:hypothetical protein